MPNESSVYAREGSAAHEIAEMALNTGQRRCDASRFVGVKLPEFPEVEVDESMCAAVQEYVDAVWDDIEKYEADGYEDWELNVEQRFDLSHVKADMFGTCDAVLYLPMWRKIIVFDYKHGWLSVPVERNKQTMYYAIGATTGKHNREIEEIELVIVQPRSGRHTIVKKWSCTLADLQDFTIELMKAADETKKPDAALNPGEWCKFCPAAAVCSVLAKKVEEIIMAEYDAVEGIKLQPAEKIPFERLKPIWDNANIIESWVKNVKAYAHAQALNGNLLPGTKLVEGRSNRKFRDEEEAESRLQVLVFTGDLEENIHITKLKSPKQIEDMLPKGKKDIIGDLVIKGRGALVLVPEEDERGSAKIDPLKEF